MIQKVPEQWQRWQIQISKHCHLYFQSLPHLYFQSLPHLYFQALLGLVITWRCSWYKPNAEIRSDTSWQCGWRIKISANHMSFWYVHRVLLGRQDRTPPKIFVVCLSMPKVPTYLLMWSREFIIVVFCTLAFCILDASSSFFKMYIAARKMTGSTWMVILWATAIFEAGVKSWNRRNGSELYYPFIEGSKKGEESTEAEA